MKAILLAFAAVIGFAAWGAQAAEEYPAPIARPIYSSVPVQDVGGGGPWSTSTVVTGNGGYASAYGAEGMPVIAPSPAASAPIYVQHGPATSPHS